MKANIWKSRSGNFGILAAVLMVPLLLAGGLAVDYANLSRLRSNLQNANDAAALMAARSFDKTGTLPSKSEVEKTLTGNLEQNASVVDLGLKDDNVVLTSTAKANLIFSGVLPEKFGQVDVLSAVKVQSDGQQLDVVLVLDNTGSMSFDSKMKALKDAAANFVETLLGLNKNGHVNVRIGIVPFSNYVNVGLDNRYAKWMNVPEDKSGTYQQCSTPRDVISRSCHPATCYNDGTPYQCQSCKTEYGPPTGPEECHEASWSNTWHGCVGSRSPAPLNVRDTRPDKPFPGILDAWCPSPITPLTANEGSLDAQVKAMRATGQTYVAEGVMWGLRVLSAAAPYAESAEDQTAADNAVKHQKIMVLMTDGDNTRSPQLPGSSANEGTDAREADRLTEEACQQVKNAKVMLYTISFGRDVSKSGKALMQGCADNGKFYDASRVSEISSAFQSIASSIAAVRLTQ